MENDQPFVSRYEWCPHCRNWFVVSSRTGFPDGNIWVTVVCGHTVVKDFDPNMDGEFKIGEMR